MEPRDRRVASLLHPSIPCLGHVFGFVVALNVMSCVRRMASLLPPRGPVVMCSCVVDVSMSRPGAGAACSTPLRVLLSVCGDVLCCGFILLVGAVHAGGTCPCVFVLYDLTWVWGWVSAGREGGVTGMHLRVFRSVCVVLVWCLGRV